MEEPEDPTSKRYYFEGLLLLARYKLSQSPKFSVETFLL